MYGIADAGKQTGKYTQTTKEIGQCVKDVGVGANRGGPTAPTNPTSWDEGASGDLLVVAVQENKRKGKSKTNCLKEWTVVYDHGFRAAGEDVKTSVVPSRGKEGWAGACQVYGICVHGWRRRDALGNQQYPSTMEDALLE